MTSISTWTRSSSRAYMPYPDHAVAHAPTGPLAGLSFTVKDMFDVEGYPTSAGSPTMLAVSGIKSTNAAAVQLLLDAGARRRLLQSQSGLIARIAHDFADGRRFRVDRKDPLVAFDRFGNDRLPDPDRSIAGGAGRRSG